MACYSPDGTSEETDPERIKINKIFADKNNKIEDLIKRNKYLEAGLCAIITELEKRNIANEIINKASKNGIIDLINFWNCHFDNDKTRLSVELFKYSEHEKAIIKQILNENR